MRSSTAKALQTAKTEPIFKSTFICVLDLVFFIGKLHTHKMGFEPMITLSLELIREEVQVELELINDAIHNTSQLLIIHQHNTF